MPWGGIRGLTLLILNSALDGGGVGVLNATRRPVYPLKVVPIPINRTQSGASVPVGTDMEKRKSSAPAGIQTPYRPALNVSLYGLRLSWPTFLSWDSRQSPVTTVSGWGYEPRIFQIWKKVVLDCDVSGAHNIHLTSQLSTEFMRRWYSKLHKI